MAAADFDPRPPMPTRLSAEFGSRFWHPYWSLRTDVLLDGVKLGHVFEADAEEGWAEVGVVAAMDGRGNVRLAIVPNPDGGSYRFERAVLRGAVVFAPKGGR